MKLWKKIVLGTIAVILVAAAAVTIWQWENISALYLYASNSGEQIEQMAQEKHKEKEEVLGKYEGITVQDLTPEQESAIISGELTVEDAVKEIEKTPAKENNPQPSKPAPVVDKESEIVNRYLKQIYTLKAEFLGKLANLKDDAQAEFYKYPMKERTKANKTKVITDKIIECYELENSCDIAIEKLLKAMSDELKAVGGDLTIISEIRTTYKEEKSTKKAYYMKLATE